MSMVADSLPGAEVYYPEGPHVPEGDLQMRRRIELAVVLRSWVGEHHPGGWVCCDINIYYREGDPRVVVAPDIAVAFGVNIPAVENKPTYKVWEAGAAPCFALEIASPNTYKVDLRAKPPKFADLGVTEYWRFDPTGGDFLGTPLAGEHRRQGRLGTHPNLIRNPRPRRRAAPRPQRRLGPGPLLGPSQTAPLPSPPPPPGCETTKTKPPEPTPQKPEPRPPKPNWPPCATTSIASPDSPTPHHT